MSKLHDDIEKFANTSALFKTYYGLQRDTQKSMADVDFKKRALLIIERAVEKCYEYGCATNGPNYLYTAERALHNHTSLNEKTYFDTYLREVLPGGYLHEDRLKEQFEQTGRSG